MNRVKYTDGCVLLLFAGLAWAQTGPTGGLSGRVTDPANAAIPEAAVEVRNTETGVSRAVKSNAEGYWEVRFLPAGRYEVRVQATGFQALIQTDVPVEAAVLTAVPGQLQVGALSDAITVVGEVPLVPQAADRPVQALQRDRGEQVADGLRGSGAIDARWCVRSC